MIDEATKAKRDADWQEVLKQVSTKPRWDVSIFSWEGTAKYLDMASTPEERVARRRELEAREEEMACA